MSSHTYTHFESGGVQSDVRKAVQHSKEYAVDELQFERMVDASHHRDEYEALESRVILHVLGRLGLRCGELIHMREDWIDWRDQQITIPGHQPCEKGRNGGVCGSCHQNAKQKAGIATENNYAEAHADLGPDDELEPGGGRAYDAIVPVAEIEESYWRAKSPMAARTISLEQQPRAEIVLEEYFGRFDRFKVSHTTVTRRINDMAALVDGLAPADIQPHGLRATAATFWANHGLEVMALQAMFGWVQIQTAKAYVVLSDETTVRAMQNTRM